MPSDPDASEEAPALVSLAVHLAPDQIEWLSEQATRQNVAVDHIVRRLVDRARAAGPSRDTGTASPAGDDASRDAPPSSDAETALDRLRQVQKRVQDLTEGPIDASPSATDDDSEPDDPPSMFDMADRDEGT